MRNITKKIIKFVLAGLIAFAALNVFSFFYYMVPPQLPSETGATDYVWESYGRIHDMKEGFAYVRMNNEGLNNDWDYDGKPVDILLMGSSQIESAHVAWEKTAAAHLDRLFKGEKRVYNLGFSGHYFPRVVSNIENAIQRYRPKECVIIETGSVCFTESELRDNFDQDPTLPDSKLKQYIKKFPYMVLIYKQLQGFAGVASDEVPVGSAAPADIFSGSGNEAERYRYLNTLDAVMSKLSRVAKDNNIDIIILYHPFLLLADDGSAYANTDAGYLSAFEKSCSENGIGFIDMGNDFMERYKTARTLPYGFANSAVGTGHLNESGQEMIADELFRQISAAETGGAPE